MTYKTYEESISDGAPVECYKFTGEFGSWHYTSHETAIVFKNNTYIPTPVRRGSFKVPLISEGATELSIEIITDAAVVKNYAFSDTQPAKLALTIYRFHYNDDNDQDQNHAIIWAGDIISMKANGGKTVLISQNHAEASLARELPQTWYQNYCNHVLYDGGCRVRPEDHREVVRVLGVQDHRIDTTNINAPSRFLGGAARGLRTGETRTIVDCTHTSVTLNLPALNIVRADELSLLMGCDHTFKTCKDSFNNTKNFGGFPTIPRDSSARGGGL